MAVLGSEHSETVLVQAGAVIPLSLVNLCIIYNKPFLTIWWIFKFFSFRKESKNVISIFVALKCNCLVWRHYLWISWLWFGMRCIYGGDLAHCCVGDLEWIHNNISLCSRCLSVSTHHSCPFTNAPSTAGVRSIFGVPRNLWWCKKKRNLGEKTISWADILLYKYIIR